MIVATTTRYTTRSALADAHLAGHRRTFVTTPRKILALALLLALLVGLPYGDQGAAAGTPSQTGHGTAQTPHGPHDERLGRVGSAVPAFAGFTLEEIADQTTEMVVLSTRADKGVIGQVRRELAAEFGHEFGAISFEIRKVDYSFNELKQWYDRLRLGVLAAAGVVHTDLDEAKNRLSIGIEAGGSARALVEAEIARSGVERNAVVIEEVQPVVQELQSYRRPLIGGIQINWFDDNDGLEYICSLGFNAVRNGVQGFVTNSHCSSQQGAVDGQVYHQPIGLIGFDIGQETVDPALFTTGGCPSGRRCRYTDANFSRTQCGFIGCNATFAQGFIARVASGSTAWNGSNRWRIVGEWTPAIDVTVQKTGRTTGRTGGTVSRTCVDVNVSGTNISMLCQGQASYSSAGGDSGGPVFDVVDTPSAFDVRIAGVHWGSGGTFTPIDNFTIAGEVGGMNECASGFSC